MATEKRLTFPTDRFWSNSCTGCSKTGDKCHHLPFGRVFDWQRWAFSALDRGARQAYLELHRRSRKSSSMIQYQFKQAMSSPNTRHNWIGPTFTEVRRVVWDDPAMLWSVIPEGWKELGFRVSEHRMTVRFPNGSVWQCYGGETPDDLKGIDGETFVFDEWALQNIECWSKVVQPIWAQHESRKVIFIFTPQGQNHAAQMLDYAAYVDEGDPLPANGMPNRVRPGCFVYRLSADHSGIFSEGQLRDIRSDPFTTPEIFQQEYLIKRVTEEQFALITSAMLDNLFVEVDRPRACRAIIACDPSMGGDACAISVQWHSEEILHKSIRTSDTMRIVGELRAISDETGIMDYIVDSIGVGKGVADRLSEDSRYFVQHFDSGAKAAEPDRFYNRRAEMWWHAREDVYECKCCQPTEETKRQIPFASRYKVGSNGRIQIVLKDKIRDELGRSPDDAEAWALGREGLRYARECAGKAIEWVVERPSDLESQQEEYDTSIWHRQATRTRA